MNKLEKLRDKMDCNGYAHFNYDNFKSGRGVCYIPENAEDLTDTYTRKMLVELVSDFIDENPDNSLRVKKSNQDLNDLKKSTLTNLWMSLQWEDPSTVLDQMLIN
jgi:hypothetical protein